MSRTFRYRKVFLLVKLLAIFIFNNMIQEKFAFYVVEIFKKDIAVVGLAVAGSWITNELDEYSDPDLILITNQKLLAGATNHLLRLIAVPLAKNY